MELNDLLIKKGIDPAQVIVMRHRPVEKELRRILPWLVHERPELFNAYQRHHNGSQERSLASLTGKGWLAAFIGLRPSEAVFAGLYRIQGAREVTHDEFWAIPQNAKLKEHGLIGWTKAQDARSLWFDLVLESTLGEWTGKLAVAWPPPERSWWRRAEKNVMPVLTISEESRFAEKMQDWQDLVLSWGELHAIPASWRAALGQWRGIYFIHDTSDGRGYVGSAGGLDHLLGRWLGYAKTGDGGNKLLVKRAPENFRFSILQRVSPDMPVDEIVALESTWKKRLHTRAPHGLNAN